MSGSTIGGFAGAIVGSFFGQPQLGFMIGSMIGGYIDPEIIKQTGPRLMDAANQTSRDGVPIVRGWGTFPCSGNIIWQTDPVEHVTVTEDDGKGGPVTETTTYSYTRSYAVGICQGPVTGLLIAKRNGKIVYDTRTDAELTALGYTSAQISEVRAASGAFANAVELYLGDETQLASPTIEAVEGVGEVNANRGLCYMVVPNDDVTETRKAIPQWEFVVCGSGTVTVDPILQDGPILYWKLDETGGTQALDYSGNNYHGDYFGDYTLHGETGVEWGATVRTGGVIYSGSEPVDLDVGTDGVFSVETVATITEHGSSASSLFWKGQSLSGISNWRLWVRDDDNPPDYTLEGTTAPAIDLGVKHHYCLTSDGTSFRYYIDGSLVHTSAYVASGTTDNPVRIGSDEHPNSHCWKGTQRNAALFGVCLTPFQVASHAAFGSLSPDLGLEIPGAPGSFVDNEGNVYSLESITTARDTVLASTIVADLCADSGLTADEYDVSQLTDELDGYRIASEGGADVFIAPLLQVCFADVGEWDGKLRFIKRGGAATFALTPDDLVERDGDAIEQERVQEAELLRRVTVGYLDPAAQYTPTTQKWERRAGTVLAKGEASMELPVVITATPAAQIAEKKGKVAWGEPDKYLFSLSQAWSKLTPTDVGTLTTKAGAVLKCRLMGREDDSGVLLMEATKNSQAAYTGTATGTSPVTPTIPTANLIGPTQALVLNLPAMADAQDEVGLHIAARGLLSDWRGAQIYFSTDGGATPSVATVIDQPAAIGYTTTALPAWDSAEYPSVQSVTVWLPRAASSVSYETMLRYNNRAALQNDSGDWEVLQYQTVVANGDNSYTLSGLVRGRYATTPGATASGANFVLLDAAVKFVRAERWMIGETLTVKPVSLGTDPDEAASQDFVFDPCVSQTEWPVAYVAAERDGSDNVTVTWQGRARLGTETAPHHSQYFTGYRVTFDDGVAPVSFDTTDETYTLASAADPITVTVAALNSITGAGPASTGIIV